MAQAVVLNVPNLWQVIVDDTAGTQTFQTYDTTTSAWVTQWTLNLSTGAITLAQGQTVSGNLSVSGTAAITDAVTAGGVNPSNAVTSVAGTTAGTIYWVMPFQGSGYKKAIVYLDAYENDTATAQTITYPTAFVQTPNLYNPAGVAGVSTTTTELSIDPDNTTAYTGWIVVEGY